MFYVMKEEHVDHIPTSLVLSRWTKDAKIEYLNMNYNDSVDSNLNEQAWFRAYCYAFTIFCKQTSKKNGVHGEIMDGIMNFQKKYCSTDDPIGTTKSAVDDPMMVKSKTAPKKK